MVGVVPAQMGIDGRGHGVDIADAGNVPRSDPESSHLAVLTGEISIGAQMLCLLIAGGNRAGGRLRGNLTGAW
ncbi:Uncharacterised protein [Mycobacteroides abscessus subsp. abscessus]|nr:Uncharacterised protein [Mycobacteroides abscessus subsp. abscessus]